MKNQSGFNILELVIVFIILGILGAIAIPKYFNLMKDTRMSATNDLATSLSTANGMNVEARKKNSSKGIAIANCTDVSKLLKEGLPKDYIITPASIAVNATVTCTLHGPGDTSASFTATGIH